MAPQVPDIKMKQPLKLVPWVLLVGVIAFSSCKKENFDTPAMSSPRPSQFLPYQSGVVANAGLDRIIVLPNSPHRLPTDFIRLDGWHSYDSSGLPLSSFLWRQIAGPNRCSITYSKSDTTPINNLTEGIYSFELTVTGTSGAMDKDTVMMNVIRDTLSGKEVTLSNFTWDFDNSMGDDIYFYIDSPDFYTSDRLMEISLSLDTSSVWIDAPIYYGWYFYLPVPQNKGFVCTFTLGMPARLFVENMPPLNYQLIGANVSVKVKFL